MKYEGKRFLEFPELEFSGVSCIFISLFLSRSLKKFEILKKLKEQYYMVVSFFFFFLKYLPK